MRTGQIQVDRKTDEMVHPNTKINKIVDKKAIKFFVGVIMIFFPFIL